MKDAFNPIFSITPEIAHNLMRIEAARQQVISLPMNPTVLRSLRETAKLHTTHYSTMIEGNRLTEQQVQEVLLLDKHIPEKERDEREVKGFYEALELVERYAKEIKPITEKQLQTLHAVVMAGGNTRVKPTPYRTGQNVIRNGHSGTIVYMPPEAKDVPLLMKVLVAWISHSDAPSPLVAAVAHYQFATIHPYYDGNGRTARLLATLILHVGGYDLKGLYSLEEYYAKDLQAYYDAITIGPSHNYYMGRAEADITTWIAYFIEGMAIACEKVIKQMTKAQEAGLQDHEQSMRTLDPKQRKALELFKQYRVITNAQLAEFLGFTLRSSAALCKKWVNEGFLQVVNPSFKARTYTLAVPYEKLV